MTTDSGKEQTNQVELSFVIIGYNEGKTLGACFASIHNADLDNISHEIIYVDGGQHLLGNGV